MRSKIIIKDRDLVDKVDNKSLRTKIIITQHLLKMLIQRRIINNKELSKILLNFSIDKALITKSNNPLNCSSNLHSQLIIKTMPITYFKIKERVRLPMLIKFKIIKTKLTKRRITATNNLTKSNSQNKDLKSNSCVTKLAKVF